VGGMKEAIREGRYVWQAPVGYRNLKIGGQANIAPDEMAILVQETFREIAKNLEPVEEIRRRMQRKGLINKKGKSVSRSYFYVMLRNRLYAGTICAFRERHKGMFEPLITEALYEQVQRVLRFRARRTTQYELDNPDFPLRRFVRHPRGASLTGCWCAGRKNKYAYYRYLAPKQLFKKEALEKSFMDFLDSYELDEAHLKAFRTKVKPAFLKAVKCRGDSRFNTEKRVAELKAKQTALVQKNIEGFISNQVLQGQLEQIEVALRDAYAQLMREPATGYDEAALNALFRFIESVLRKPSEAWKQASFKQKIQLQRFAFPKGLLFDGLNFQTAEVCFVFKLKALTEPYVSYRVHSDSKCSNNPEVTILESIDEIAQEIKVLSGILEEREEADSS
jgi:hypothetical protein